MEGILPFGDQSEFIVLRQSQQFNDGLGVESLDCSYYHIWSLSILNIK